MSLSGSIGRLASAPVRLSVKAIVAGLDGLNRIVTRLYDRFDAGLSERTALLRGRYARRTDLRANPPPTVGGVANRADLLTGDDVKAAA